MLICFIISFFAFFLLITHHRKLCSTKWACHRSRFKTATFWKPLIIIPLAVRVICFKNSFFVHLLLLTMYRVLYERSWSLLFWMVSLKQLLWEMLTYNFQLVLRAICIFIWFLITFAVRRVGIGCFTKGA